MLKENKGITLVALVITIIVMLILAGVSISLVVGDNGVLTNATNAVDANAEAEMQQEAELAISSAASDCLVAYTTNRTVSIMNYITDDYLKAYYDTTTYTIAISTTSDTNDTITITENASTDSITGTLTYSGTPQLYVSVKWN